MLRASSLGLSFPLPTLLTAQPCRRLCGVRNKWVIYARRISCQANDKDGGKGHESVSVSSASMKEGSAHPEAFKHNPKYQQMLLHHNIHLQGLYSKEEEEVTGEGWQGKAQEDLVEERNLEKKGDILRVLSTCHQNTKSMTSLSMENTTSSGTSMAVEDQKPSESQHAPKAQQTPVTQKFARLTSEREEQSRRRGHVITKASPYPAGKPWSMESVKPVRIPNHILMRIASMKRAINIANAQYERKKMRQKRKGKVRAIWKVQRKRTLNQNISRIVRGRRKTPHKLMHQDVQIKPDIQRDPPPSPHVPFLIHDHLQIVGNTDSVDKAWSSYVYLVDTIASHPLIYNRMNHICHSHLHRFCRLLSRARPRTHLQYLRLLSVMTYIVHCGGRLKFPIWNALIMHSAAQRRKMTVSDVETALNVYRGMQRGELPFTSAFETPDSRLAPPQTAFDADVVTMSTLLSLAARSGDETLLQQIWTDMKTFGITPNRYTHLVFFRYFAEKKDLSGVRQTIRNMKKQGLEIGLDGLNAILWAYGINDRLDIVLMIYRTLRHNRQPEVHEGSTDIASVKAKLAAEYIVVDDDMIPNEITYTAVIQLLSYNGHFEPAIKVFIDMLSTDNVEQGAPLYSSNTGELKPHTYVPTLPVYRALFIGFQRHGIHPEQTREDGPPTWTIRNLINVFERFLIALSGEARLSFAFLDIVMAAFARTSGNDLRTMRKAWMAMDEKFGIVFPKSNANHRLQRLQRLLFPPEGQRPI